MTNVLIMRSADSQDHVRVMNFPATWTWAKADEEYHAALTESQVGDDWTWEDIEAAMLKRGFIETNWHIAEYTWDETAKSDSGCDDIVDCPGEV